MTSIPYVVGDDTEVIYILTFMFWCVDYNFEFRAIKQTVSIARIFNSLHLIIPHVAFTQF